MMTLGNMRENERVGWPIVIVTVWILIAALPAIAQTERWPSLEEIIKVTREAFRTAKNKDQVESVKLWCRDGVDSLSHNEKMGLLREGDRLINAGKMVEADRPYLRSSKRSMTRMTNTSKKNDDPREHARKWCAHSRSTPVRGMVTC